MKKYLKILIFVLFFLLTSNVHAFSSSDYKIVLYDSTSEVVSCPNSLCDTGLMRNITRVSIYNYSNSLIQNNPYTLYASINIETDVTGSSLPFRNDMWLGNSTANSWVQLTTSWNHIDNITSGSLPYTRIFYWGYVGSFTPTYNSNGLVFDFYFTNPGINIWSVELLRFDIENNGSSNESVINNQTNTIINNNNTNTQNIIDSQEGIKDAITDDTIDSDTGTDFFDDFESQDFGLSQIITLPLTTIQSLTSTSCLSLTIPVPFTDDTLSLPCMADIYDNYIHDVYALWKIVSFGIISYYICLDIFKIVKGFKDPESDKIEVLDL